MIRFLIVSLFILSIQSCSTIEFVENGQTPYKVSAAKGSDKVIEVIEETPFYFWGAFPPKADISFDKLFFEKGVYHPGMVKIQRINTFKTVMWSLVTLGLYMPEAYSVSVYSAENER